MRFYFYAPYQDEQQMAAIREYRFPYPKYVVGVNGKDFGAAKERDVIAIFGHGMEAQDSNLLDPDLRAMHNYSLWGSEGNPFNEAGPPTRFESLPMVMTSLGLKPAKYTFFFCVCFAGQDSFKRSPCSARPEKQYWMPNIEVFANRLTDEGKGFAGSAVFGPTGPILRPLNFWARYQTVSYDDWVSNDRKPERCVVQHREVPIVNTTAIEGVVTKRTCPEKTQLEQFFPGGFFPKR